MRCRASTDEHGRENGFEKVIRVMVASDQTPPSSILLVVPKFDGAWSNRWVLNFTRPHVRMMGDQSGLLRGAVKRGFI